MDPTSSQSPPSLPVLDNPSSRAVHAVLDLVQRERGTWLAPRIARLHSPEVCTEAPAASNEMWPCSPAASRHCQMHPYLIAGPCR